MKNYYWLLVIVIGLNSCESSTIYENVTDFKNSYWLADSIKKFDFEIENPSTEYRVLLNIRNGIEYPHNNIYIRYSIVDSSKNILDEELRNFQLFHPKSGHPFGNGSGNIKEHQFDLVVDYKFPYTGKYTISFEQFMRYDSLPEIYSVGVTLAKQSD